MSLPSMQHRQLPKPRPAPLDLSKAMPRAEEAVVAPQRSSSLAQSDEDDELYPMIDIKPLRIRRQSLRVESPVNVSQQRLKRDEALAIDSLNAFLSNPFSPTKSTHSIPFHRTSPLEPLQARQGSVDYATKILPAVPRQLPFTPAAGSLAERRRSSLGPRPTSMFVAEVHAADKILLRSSVTRQSQTPLYGYI